MRINRIILFIFSVVMLASCKKFLDVKPKTQIDADVAFRDEQGFMDALTGVYLNLNTDNLYGKELTFGLPELLAKQHTRFTSTFHEYYDASFYRYTNVNVRGKIDAIWKAMYNSIAENNTLITNLERADKRMFRDVNYSIIRGEAYGLRAFMHFDLLRLFAPAPASPNGNTTKSIPYFDRMTVDALPRLTVQELINRIIADLATAEAALKTTDPIVPGSTTPTTTTGYLRDRFYKFNYYAVKALQARVYLYAGDKLKALAAAQEVINANVFPFANVSSINAGNHVMIEELVFTLFKADIANLVTSYFIPASNNLLTKTSDGEFQDVYESTGDLRYTLLTALDNTSSNIRYSTRLDQSTGISAAYTRKMPVIRISEMYYIAAECSGDVSYLNAVRRARNVLNDLPANLTPEQFQTELFKEYRKEFYCEGQLFYFYKRLNIANIEYSNVTANNEIYVLPLPDTEVEYGNGN